MRYRQHLIGQYRAILGYLGNIILLIAITILVPLILLPFYPEEFEHVIDFLLPGGALVALGFWLRRYKPQGQQTLTIQEGMVVVILAWGAAILFGSLPFIIGDHLNLTLATFESTSGWTSTGLSIIDNVEDEARMILFYRSVIQLVGGAGFVVIVLSTITGPAGVGLSAAEGHDEQIVPHVRESAEIVIRLYLVYNLFGIVALRLAGMNWFDAVNHAFTAVATAGFSTRAESIGHWDSPAVEGVIIILMLLGSLNFFVAYLIAQGKFRPVRHNTEIRAMAILIGIGGAVVLLTSTLGTYTNTFKDVRVALFEVISAVSTCGFNTVGYSTLAPAAWVVLTALMIIGGNSGSTAGAIKQLRIIVLFQAAAWEIRRAFLPPSAVNQPMIWRGEERIFLSNEMIRGASLYVFVYISILFVGTGFTAAHGYSVGESLFEYASAMGTVGLSVGVTSSAAPPTVLWGLVVGMIVGRLEFFAVVIGVIKLARDGRVLARPTKGIS